MASLLFGLSTILPIFILIVGGMILRRTGLIGSGFVASASVLVFRVALPVMVFQQMAGIPSVPAGIWGSLVVMAAVTIVVPAAVFFIVSRPGRALPGPTRASLLQGSFRSNIAVVGFAVLENSLGPAGAALGAIVLAVIMPLYNLVAIVVLTHGARTEEAVERPALLRTVLLQVVKNPLIWAVVLGLPLGLLRVELPAPATTTLGYVSRLTLPLALFSIGATLRLEGLFKRGGLWGSATFLKLVVVPALVYGGLALLGVEQELTAVVVIAAACPTAVVSFAMADAMGGDSELAGEIVSASTLLSVLTLSVWVAILVGA